MAVWTLAMQWILANEKYDELEALHTRFRKNDERFANGACKIPTFYYALKAPLSNNAIDKQRVVHRLYRWLRIKPKSALPHLALARLLWDVKARPDYWRTREGAFVGLSSSELSAPLKAARTHLESARNLDHNNPDIYALLIEQVRLEKGALEEGERYYRAGHKLDPKNYHLDGRYSKLLIDRGRDWKEAISNSEDALLAYHFYFSDTHADPQALLPLAISCRRAHPESRLVANLSARIACEAQDWETARREFDWLGAQHESDAWNMRDFLRARAEVARRAKLKPPSSQTHITAVPDEAQQPIIEYLLLCRNTTALFDRQRFAELDGIAEELTHENPRLRNAYPLQNSFFGCLQREQYGIWEPLERIDLCRAWRAQRPQSYASILLEIQAEVKKAWKDRGCGFANEVTPDGWKGFRTHLDQAQSLYDNYEKENFPCVPYLCSLRIAIGMGKSEPNSLLFDVLKKAATVDPYNPDPYGAVYLALMPRWGGSNNELTKFLKSIPPEVFEDVIGWDSESNPLPAQESRKLSAIGLNKLAQRFPSTETWSRALVRAREVSDRKLAQEALKNLKGQWSPSYIEDSDQAVKIADWAKCS